MTVPGSARLSLALPNWPPAITRRGHLTPTPGLQCPPGLPCGRNSPLRRRGTNPQEDREMNRAEELADQLYAEACALPVGSSDRMWRERAAWKLQQMATGVPACDWTDEPQRMAAE